MPTPLYKSLARHFWFRTTYLAQTAPVPAKIRQALGRREAVVRDYAVPPHTVRWVGEDRLLVSGADGDAPPPRLRDKTIVQRTGQLMYELSTLYPDISGLQPELRLGRRLRASAPTDCRASARTGTFRTTCSLSAMRATASPARTSPAASCVRQHFEEMDPADEVFGFHR